MSKRQPLVNGQYYHVFNRGQDHRLTFSNKYEFRRAISAVEYYRYSNPLSLSKFLALGSQDRGIILAQQAAKQPLVSIVAYCLMPTHFHFLCDRRWKAVYRTTLARFKIAILDFLIPGMRGKERCS